MKNSLKILLVQTANSNLGDNVIADNHAYILSRICKKILPQSDFRIFNYSIASRDIAQVRFADAVVFAGGILKVTNEKFHVYIPELLTEAQKYNVPVFMSSIGVEAFYADNEQSRELREALNLPCVRGFSIRDDIDTFKRDYITTSNARIWPVHDIAIWSGLTYADSIAYHKMAAKPCNDADTSALCNAAPFPGSDADKHTYSTSASCDAAPLLCNDADENDRPFQYDANVLPCDRIVYTNELKTLENLSVRMRRRFIWPRRCSGKNFGTDAAPIGLGIVRARLFEDYGHPEITEEMQLKFWLDTIAELDRRGLQWRIFTNGDSYDEEMAGKVLRAAFDASNPANASGSVNAAAHAPAQDHESADEQADTSMDTNLNANEAPDASMDANIKSSELLNASMTVNINNSEMPDTLTDNHIYASRSAITSTQCYGYISESAQACENAVLHDNCEKSFFDYQCCHKCRVPMDGADLVNVISDFSGVIAGRMHSNIIAYALGIPSVGIIWNQKLRFWGRKIGHLERFFEVFNCEPVSCIETLIKARKDKSNAPSRKYLKAVAEPLEQFIKEVAGGSRDSAKDVTPADEKLQNGKSDDGAPAEVRPQNGKSDDGIQAVEKLQNGKSDDVTPADEKCQSGKSNDGKPTEVKLQNEKSRNVTQDGTMSHTDAPISRAGTEKLENTRLCANHLGSLRTRYPNTNSPEAFANALSSGYRCMEVDVRLTSDGELVCVNRWHQDTYHMLWMDSELPEEPGKGIPAGEFAARKYYNRYHTMTFDGLIGLLRSSLPDVTLIISVGKPNEETMKILAAEIARKLAAAGAGRVKYIFRFERRADLKVLREAPETRGANLKVLREATETRGADLKVLREATETCGAAELMYYFVADRKMLDDERLLEKKFAEGVEWARANDIAYVALGSGIYSAKRVNKIHAAGLGACLFSNDKLDQILDAAAAGTDIIANSTYPPDYLQELLR